MVLSSFEIWKKLGPRVGLGACTTTANVLLIGQRSSPVEIVWETIPPTDEKNFNVSLDFVKLFEHLI